MQVIVRVNGTLAQKVGLARFPVELPAQATVDDLLQALRDRHPEADAELCRVVAVVGGTHQSTSVTLESGQEVALLLPVAGG